MANGFPVYTIIKGIFSTLGLTYPPAAPPVGAIEIETLETTDRVEIVTCGYGPWLRFAELLRDSTYLPMIHIDEIAPITDGDGPHARLHKATIAIYYSELYNATNNANPVVNAASRANAIYKLLDESWKTLNTSPELCLNSEVGDPTINNDWQRYNTKIQANRITYMIPLRVELREIKPEAV